MNNNRDLLVKNNYLVGILRVGFVLIRISSNILFPVISTFLDIKNSVRSIALRKYHLFLGNNQDLPALADVRKEYVRVKSDASLDRDSKGHG